MHTYDYVSSVSYQTWIAALAASACIGCTSLVPWFFNMTFFEQPKGGKDANGKGESDGRMKFLLSFALGAIMGDIFFHLLPESLQTHLSEHDDTTEVAYRKVGLSIISGIFMFLLIEIVLENWSSPINDKNTDVANPESPNTFEESVKKDGDLKLTLGSKHGALNCNNLENNNNNMTDLNSFDSGISCDTHPGEMSYETQQSNLRTTSKIKANGSASQDIQARKKGNQSHNSNIVDMSGYLNLIANGFDNFTHGLAIGASFLVGPKVGILTTFVIIIHEIPHEICDYAILVNSGFSRLDAVKAQSSVSLFGILGTATALYVKSMDTLSSRTNWILPFSAGGFLHIALVNLLPEILDREASFRSTLQQIVGVVIGISFMAAVAVI